MRLSKNFTLRELTKSDTAIRAGIKNKPDAEQLANLQYLATELLQRIRDGVARPVIVSSGFRCAALNAHVGSKSTSQHTRGEAADFQVAGMDNRALAEWILANVEFDQLILEFYEPGDPHSGWVHCSIRRDGGNRREILTASRAAVGTVYTVGLPPVERGDVA